MNVQNIIEKFGYTGELVEFFVLLYQGIVDYLGIDKEHIIYEALFNTEIVLCDSVYDALVARELIKSVDKKEDKESVLKHASGVYYSDCDVIYNIETKRFEISNIKRVLAIRASDLKDEKIKSILIHELSHFVKSYYKEFVIEDDILIIRCGLKEVKYKLSFEDGIVKKTKISEKGVGLEEGLNSVMEEDLMRMLVNPEYKKDNYVFVNSISRVLTDTFELKDSILNAQTLGEKRAFIKEFDEMFTLGTYDRLEDIMDRIYSLTLAGVQEAYITNTNKALKIIEEEFVPLREEMESIRQAKLGG